MDFNELVKSKDNEEVKIIYEKAVETACKEQQVVVQSAKCKQTEDLEMSEEIEVVAYRIEHPTCEFKVYEQRQDWAYQEYGGLRFEVQDLMTVAQHNRIVEQYKRDAERMREALELWLADYDEVALNPDFEPYPHVAVRVEKTHAAISDHFRNDEQIVKPECGCCVESDEKFGSLIYTCPRHDNSATAQQAEVNP